MTPTPLTERLAERVKALIAKWQSYIEKMRTGSVNLVHQSTKDVVQDYIEHADHFITDLQTLEPLVSGLDSFADALSEQQVHDAMIATQLEFGDKQVGFVCGRGSRKPPKCAFCPKESTKLCDYPLDRNHTCDLPMCDERAKRQAPNVDTCPNHPAMRYF